LNTRQSRQYVAPNRRREPRAPHNVNAVTELKQPNPDVKDWTWVLSKQCPDCGFDASSITLIDLPGLIDGVIAKFADRLGEEDAARRPTPQVWSPLEYACHVRDVCGMFAGRLGRMLDGHDPLFANWDQDATAIEQRYWDQDPAVVLTQLRPAAASIGAGFASVPVEQQQRRGRRSDGAVFTVDTLGRYFVHDLVHHARDIRSTP